MRNLNRWNIDRLIVRINSPELFFCYQELRRANVSPRFNLLFRCSIYRGCLTGYGRFRKTTKILLQGIARQSRERPFLAGTLIFNTWHGLSGRDKAFFVFESRISSSGVTYAAPEAARNGRPWTRGTGKRRRRVSVRGLSSLCHKAVVGVCTNTSYHGSLIHVRTSQRGCRRRQCLIVIPLELLDIPQSAHF